MDYVLEGTSVIFQEKNYLFLATMYENMYPSLLNAVQASYDMNEPESYNEADSEEITLSQVLEVLE